METMRSNETVNSTLLENFFTGLSIPKNYDTYMGPVLFTPYALDMLERMNLKQPIKILELAAGTGRLTKLIVENMPAGSELFATDISADMLAIAKETVINPTITWATVDIAAIPFEDEAFDLVVCQFGIMFVPDKLKAITEMRRVLKPGGKILFNTWGNLAENPIWQINFQTLKSFLGNTPFPADLGPFSMPNKEPVLQLLANSGFTNASATRVIKSAQVETASLAAKMFLMVSPVMDKSPHLFSTMQAAMEQEFRLTLGDDPMESPLLALVFEGVK